MNAKQMAQFKEWAKDRACTKCGEPCEVGIVALEIEAVQGDKVIKHDMKIMAIESSCCHAKTRKMDAYD